MTLREEVARRSGIKAVSIPKLVSNRFGSMENRAEIIKFIESIFNPELSNRSKLAIEIFDDIYQEGYENGITNAAMDAAEAGL